MIPQNKVHPIEKTETVQTPTSALTRLHRRFGLVHAIATVCGAVIGAGIFVSPSNVTKMTSSPALTLVTWAAAGVASLLGALVYTELGTIYPQSGGAYTYLHQLYGPYLSFLYAWMTALVYGPGSMALKVLIFSHYVLQLFHEGELPQSAVICLSVVITCLLCFFNSITVRWSARGQTVLSSCALILLITIICTGFISTAKSREPVDLGFTGSSLNVGDWIIGFFAASFAYSGYNALNCLIEEVVDPIRTLPRAMCISMLLITVCYLLTNVSYLMVLGAEGVSSSNVVVQNFAQATVPALSLPFTLIIAIINIGSFNTALLAESRIAFAVGRGNMFPRCMALISIGYNTPMVAILMFCILVTIFSTFQLSSILSNIMFPVMLFEFLVAAGLSCNKYAHPDLHRPLKLPLCVPLIYSVFCAGLVIFSVVLMPSSTIYGMLLILGTGTPYYLVFVTRTLPVPLLERLADRILLTIQKVFYSIPEEQIDRNSNTLID